MNRTYARGRIGSTSLIVIAALAAGIGLWAGTRWLAPQSALPPLKTAVAYPNPQAIPAFKLARANGQTFTETDLKGRYTVMFFGFTHCPDICPNTLAVFKQAWNALPEASKKEKIRFAFISVDPERDTPERLASYVSYFHPDFLAATGSDDELTKLTRSLGLVYARSPDDKGGYSVDHSAAVVIVDPQGRRAGLFRPPFEAGAIQADLLTLIDAH
jgi:protein SCO1/2